jgi:uncharacterized membrane protein YkoI
MPARRTIAIGAAAVAAMALGGAATVTALDDPDGSVDAVNVSDATAGDVGSPAGQDGQIQQVPGLDELSGTVEWDDGSDDRGADDSGTDDDGTGDDGSDDDGTDDDVADELEINGVDLGFGPDDWVATADASADFDGDGSTGALRDELTGLVGQEVTMLVRFDDDGDDADVYVIDGTTYRDVSAPAPWLPVGAAGDEALRSAAAAAVGEGAEVIELDAEDDGNVAWEAKVRAADGTEREVRLDAAGAVIDVRVDD